MENCIFSENSAYPPEFIIAAIKSDKCGEEGLL